MDRLTEKKAARPNAQNAASATQLVADSRHTVAAMLNAFAAKNPSVGVYPCDLPRSDFGCRAIGPRVSRTTLLPRAILPFCQSRPLRRLIAGHHGPNHVHPQDWSIARNTAPAIAGLSSARDRSGFRIKTCARPSTNPPSPARKSGCDSGTPRASSAAKRGWRKCHQSGISRS